MNKRIITAAPLERGRRSPDPAKAFGNKSISEPPMAVAVEIEGQRFTLRAGDEAIVWIDGAPYGPMKLLPAARQPRMPVAEARSVLQRHTDALKARKETGEKDPDDSKSRVLYAISTLAGRAARGYDNLLFGKLLLHETDGEIRAAAMRAMGQATS
jgi:hypothetical protein